nr:ATP-dependent RNA helicase-like protein DB10 isoform X1 [Ipomoea trifida]
MAAIASADPRYAPEDPSLPKPWKGLVDGKTGYLYYWNPETNITQYERPGGSAPIHKSSAGFVSSSVQKSSHGQHRDNDDVDRYGRGHRGSSKPSGGEDYQSERNNYDHSRGVSNMPLVGNGASAYKNSSSTVESDLSPDAYRRRHEISVTGDNVPPPLTSFNSTGFPSEILREVHQAGFSAPTPIQAQSWPVALQGRDIVAIAKTGSGKTLGYLIPGFIHLKQRRNNSRLGPTVLVLSPTRELATQIQDEAVKFSKSYQISCTCLYGGAAKGPQLRDLDRGVDIVVATPGRLNDILEMRRVSLNQVSYLVLDEADRMLDMGFEPQIRKIVKEVPTRRQTLMYTATWPKEVRKIAADLLINPVQVNIGNVDELVANKSITQYVEVLPQTDKRRRLEQILRSQEQGSKVIIFCSTKKMCNLLAGNLTRQFGAAAIHGDKSQGERDFVLNQFRTGRSPVLVATDVAARGLDIKDIRVVINYDFPTGIEDYVHRIGRTGRAGATGLAYTFFGDQDGKYASDLIKVLEGANQRVPVELRDIALRSGGMGRARRPWGSGPAGRDGGRGRYDSGNGVRDGARGSWGMSSSSDRGGGRGYDRDSRDRHGQGSRDADSFGSYNSRNFNDSVAHTSDRHGRSRSRSPNRASGWSGDNKSRGRSRSRSVDRFKPSNPSREGPTGRSFQEAVIPRAGTSSLALKQRSPPYDSENLKRSYTNGQKDWERSPPLKGQSNREYANGSHQTCREEEEEGIIRPEEDGTYQAA